MIKEKLSELFSGESRLVSETIILFGSLSYAITATKKNLSDYITFTTVFSEIACPSSGVF